MRYFQPVAMVEKMWRKRVHVMEILHLVAIGCCVEHSLAHRMPGLGEDVRRGGAGWFMAHWTYEKIEPSGCRRYTAGARHSERLGSGRQKKSTLAGIMTVDLKLSPCALLHLRSIPVHSTWYSLVHWFIIVIELWPHCSLLRITMGGWTHHDSHSVSSGQCRAKKYTMASKRKQVFLAWRIVWSHRKHC